MIQDDAVRAWQNRGGTPNVLGVASIGAPDIVAMLAHQAAGQLAWVAS